MVSIAVSTPALATDLCVPKSAWQLSQISWQHEPNKADREELTDSLRRISGSPDPRSSVCSIAGCRRRRAQVSQAGGVSGLDLVRQWVGGSCEWLKRW